MELDSAYLKLFGLYSNITAIISEAEVFGIDKNSASLNYAGIFLSGDVSYLRVFCLLELLYIHIV
jgi:hypothetical protein